MIVLVCGGRDFDDQEYINATLDRLHKKYRFTHLVHGEARGADSCAAYWAEANGVQPVACKALWDFHGRPAGAIRNRAMLALGARRVIHFPGNRGTADMVAAAKAAGIKTVKG